MAQDDLVLDDLPFLAVAPSLHMFGLVSELCACLAMYVGESLCVMDDCVLMSVLSLDVMICLA